MQINAHTHMSPGTTRVASLSRFAEAGWTGDWTALARRCAR